MKLNVKWVFFDLGSTLIDETEADTRRINEMISGFSCQDKRQSPRSKDGPTGDNGFDQTTIKSSVHGACAHFSSKDQKIINTTAFVEKRR